MDELQQRAHDTVEKLTLPIGLEQAFQKEYTRPIDETESLEIATLIIDLCDEVKKWKGKGV